MQLVLFRVDLQTHTRCARTPDRTALRPADTTRVLIYRYRAVRCRQSVCCCLEPAGHILIQLGKLPTTASVRQGQVKWLRQYSLLSECPYPVTSFPNLSGPTQKLRSSKLPQYRPGRKSVVSLDDRSWGIVDCTSFANQG
eukprot:1012390-Rhodomonas_salina.2